MKTQGHRIAQKLNEYGLLPSYLSINDFRKFYGLNKQRLGKVYIVFNYWYEGLLPNSSIPFAIKGILLSYHRHNKTEYDKLEYRNNFHKSHVRKICNNKARELIVKKVKHNNKDASLNEYLNKYKTLRRAI